MTRQLSFVCLIGLGAVAIAGCDDDSTCVATKGDVAQAALPEKRNPDTGLCESVNFPGGGCCGDDFCDVPTGVPELDWADCYFGCEGLDESTCLDTAGCRGSYVGGQFNECWGVAPSGPIAGGDCTTFDSYTCSQHDDCIAVHAPGNPVGNFISCAPEGGTIPDPGSCTGSVTCRAEPPDCPPDTVPGIKNECWTGYCIPIAQCDNLPACANASEQVCVGQSWCSPIYEGVNCTCVGDQCTCETWVYDRCEDA